MRPLWTAAEAAAATGAEKIGDWNATGVSIDTRSLRTGDLFVALKDVRDGHDFVDAAFRAGASAALVSRDLGRPGLLAKDVLSALEDLGRRARSRAEGLLSVAVTGSVGKTSCKEMLARVFAASGTAHWSDKSFNNHWGVPLTLARMPADTQRAVFEIGMNTPGEIAPRSRMVRPHVGVVTKVAPAHLEGLGSVEAIAREKSDIFAGLEPGGAAVLPQADQHLGLLAGAARRFRPEVRVLTFGARGDAAVLSYETDGLVSRIEVDVMGETVRVAISAVGAHWAGNVALALCVAKLAGVRPAEAAESLSGYAPPAGRGVMSALPLADGGSVRLIDDSYNANPESMSAALAAFAQRPGRRIACLGEMRELGDSAASLHAGLAEHVLSAGLSVLILSGGMMDALASELAGQAGAPELVRVAGPGEAEAVLKSLLKDGDALLIKGSNASGMARVGTALRQMSEGAAAKPQNASGA